MGVSERKKEGKSQGEGEGEGREPFEGWEKGRAQMGREP